MTATIDLNGVTVLTDLSGALIWPAAATLIVADLHLEKGSALATGGTLLPPYDSRATLDRLEDAIKRHHPRRIICLGDSFHDDLAVERIDKDDAARLRRLTQSAEWIWIAGNHDPQLAGPLPWTGSYHPELTLGALAFRHQPGDGGLAGEICGHFHPKAAIATRARRVSGRCFVSDGRRLILPAFGAYAGGLDVLDPAILGLFRHGFHAYLIGRNTIRAFPRERLSPIAWSGQ